MRESKFLCIGWIPILLCSLLLLALTLAFKWRHIEQEVAAAAQVSLANSTDNWATIETFNQGRNVLLKGQAPSAEAVARAEKLASSAYGVRSAKHIGSVVTASELGDANDQVSEAQPANDAALATTSVAPSTHNDQVAPAPAKTHAQLLVSSSGDAITLSGELANQGEIDQLVAEAGRLFGAENVKNNLTIGKSIETLQATDFLSALKLRAPSDAEINLVIYGSDLRLTGKVPNDALRSELEQSLSSQFSGDIDNQLIVPKAIVSRDVCEELVKQLLADSKVNFATGKADISSDSFALLTQIVTTAKRCPDATFEVAGHTDNTGNANYNMTLSAKRAQAVVTYLLNQGLPSTQFTAKGYGPNRPIATNSTDQGRAQNRRIEFKLNN